MPRWWKPKTTPLVAGDPGAEHRGFAAQRPQPDPTADVRGLGRNAPDRLDLTGSKNMGGSNASGTFSVAGSQANGINFLLDGGDNNDAFSNVNLPIPFPDAIQEFNVQTNGLPAQYGLHPGGVVNIVTKSGANAIPRRPVRLSPQRRSQCAAGRHAWSATL